MKKHDMIRWAAVLAAAVFASCGGNGADGLSGAGATFPLPFYNAVFADYDRKGLGRVAYGGIGSGGGIRNLKDGIVDFAGSDAYLTDEELRTMGAVVHVPSCMGAVVLAYRVEGVDSLKLSGEAIAGIFSGKITVWDDPRIAALNPGEPLPHARIMPVYRSDGSGTTFVFTDYLSKVSPEWARTCGRGKTVNFAAGQAAKGNPGVAGIVAQTPNSIGYLGSEYAFAQHIRFASVVNARGECVTPDARSVAAAAAGSIPADTRTMITDSDAPGAYPISCFTWLLVYREQHYSGRSREQAAATLKLLEYVLSPEAQRLAAQVHYAPLPPGVVELSRRNLDSLTYDGVPLR